MTTDNKNTKPLKSARRRARELVAQGLYAWLQNHEKDNGSIEEASLHIDAFCRHLEHFGKADKKFFRALLDGVMANLSGLREGFSPLLDRPLAELSPVEHAVLLLGTYELAHCLDVPMRVVINEALEVSKEFGSNEAHRYINGVLDKFAAQHRALEAKAR